MRQLAFILFTALISTLAAAGPAAPDTAGPTSETAPQSGEPLGQIAIIIDDIGYHASNGMRAVQLPAPLTIAVLPFTPNGVALAEMAHRQGKEVILHAPMSNIRGLPLDRGALTEEMLQAEFVEALQKDLVAIPHIRGLNNHMGSRLTQQAEPMSWLMSELKRRQLFFIDSRTSADSRAWDIARQYRVPSLKRDIFLDNERTAAAIDRQFQQLLRIARHTGSALAIGHPYPETLEYLEHSLPRLADEQIELVYASALLPDADTTARLQAGSH